MFNIGSTAITIPAFKTGPLPLIPKLGTSGSSWTAVPTPWPHNSSTTPKLCLWAYCSIAYPISPTCAPSFMVDKPTNNDSSVSCNNFCFAGLIFPTGYVQAESPWYPL